MKRFISEINFADKHFSTTKSAGNMRNETLRNAFLASLKLSPENLVLANQIHGNGVKIVDNLDKNKFIDKCDGLITADSGIMLGIFTADCIPLLMSGRSGKIKAAIHVGWKGLLLGIIENAVEILNKEFHVKNENIKIYIGPHIRSCCYGVNREMGIKFNVKLKGGKLNLAEIIVNKLTTLGINEVFDIKRCTFHEKNLFFSYRRDKCSERMLSVIC